MGRGGLFPSASATHRNALFPSGEEFNRCNLAMRTCKVNRLQQSSSENPVHLYSKADIQNQGDFLTDFALVEQLLRAFQPSLFPLSHHFRWMRAKLNQDLVRRHLTGSTAAVSNRIKPWHSHVSALISFVSNCTNAP